MIPYDKGQTMTVCEVSKKFKQLPSWRKQMNTNRRQIQAAKEEKRVHRERLYCTGS